MKKERIENNVAVLSGVLVSEFDFSHEIFGEKFYVALLKSERISDANDVIPITISEKFIDAEKLWLGQRVRVSGQFRSYNKRAENTSHLKLTLFVRDLEVWEDDEEPVPCDENEISLDGYFCKTPIYRTTPLGREITDVLFAVNRPYEKSDYIPCICWGEDARFTSGLSVGAHCRIKGRMQSRKYKKRISKDETETRVAYEISVSEIEEVQG